MAKSQEWERVEAGQVAAGDSISRTRTTEAAKVREVRPGAVSVRLVFEGGSTIRPRKTAQLWRKVERS